MKFAVALLIATVAATDAATTDAAKKTGAASGEACDGNAAAKGCADGLRCHLGKTASNAAAAAKPKTKAICKEAKLGDFIGYTAYNVKACKYASVAEVDFKADAGTTSAPNPACAKNAAGD